MSYETYKLIHLAGVLMTFAGLGVAIGAVTKHKLAGILHGVGMLLVLVAGFGMKAKLHLEGWPSWLLVKIAIWLAIGAVPLAVKRARSSANLILLATLALGLVAAWMAVLKPIG